MSVGYAGWGAGQLEKEILANGWLTVAADPQIIFRCRSKNVLMQPSNYSVLIPSCCRPKRGMPDDYARSQG
jgi:hypothetical protein